MSKYFPPYNNSSENIKVELDLGNFATKKDIKDITHIDASGFASKTNLAALKTKVDKIDTDKLKTVPDDLAKLTNVVKNEVVKKTDFNANDYVKSTKFAADTSILDDKIDKVDKKIPDASDLEITFTLCVEDLYKVFMALRFMLKRTFTEILHYMVKSLC